MLPIFDGLRDVTLASVTTRMLLAVLCGGLIGIERAYKRRPAGFRTTFLFAGCGDHHTYQPIPLS